MTTGSGLADRVELENRSRVKEQEHCSRTVSGPVIVDFSNHEVGAGHPGQLAELLAEVRHRAVLRARHLQGRESAGSREQGAGSREQGAGSLSDLELCWRPAGV